MAQPSSDEFAARAEKLFASLHGAGAASSAWNLNTQQGFAAGGEDRDSSEEEDEEERGPQSLPGAAGSDEDENEYKAKASLQYCAAFEAEPEEDQYDLLAAGEEQEEGQAGAAAAAAAAAAHVLQKSMQVLNDNAYDRAHQHRTQQQQHHTVTTAMEVEDAAGLPSWQQAAAAAAATVTEAADGGEAGATTTTQQQQQQPAKRMKPRGGVWVPPHRRPDYKPEDQPHSQLHGQEQQLQHPSDQQQEQNQRRERQQRRVTFSEDAVAIGSQQQEHQQHSRAPPRAGGGGRGRRGRGRGVPDHIANPQRYTVYVLDEPLFVGQGGADVESEAAASSWQLQQRQQQQQGKHSKLDANCRREIEEPVEQLVVGVGASAGGIADVAAMEVEEAPAAAAAAAAPELPAPGGIKFAPTGHVRSKAAEANGKQQKHGNGAKGAFCDDQEAAEDAEQTPPVVHKGKTARRYRSK